MTGPTHVIIATSDKSTSTLIEAIIAKGNYTVRTVSDLSTLSSEETAVSILITDQTGGRLPDSIRRRLARLSPSAVLFLQAPSLPCRYSSWLPVGCSLDFIRTPVEEEELIFRLSRLAATKTEASMTRGRDHSETLDLIGRTMFVDNPDYLLALAIDGRILHINPALLEATGYTAEESIGARFTELFLNDSDQRTAGTSLAAVARDNTEGRLEMEMRTKTGAPIKVDWRYRTRSVLDDSTPIIVASGRDVTLWNRAVDAMGDSQGVFRSILDRVQYGMLVLDPHLQVVYFNSVFVDHFSSKHDELIGRKIEEVLNECVGLQSARKMAALIAECSLNGKSVDRRVFAAVIPNRGVRWFEMRVTPIESSKIRRTVVHLIDVTDRRSAQSNLIAREHHYRNLFTTAPLGIIAVDREGRIVEMNNKLLEMFESQDAGLSRRRDLFTFPPVVETGFSEDLKRCFETGDTIVSERPYHSGTGRELILRYYLTPLKSARGVINQVQAFIEDISEKRRLERKLLQARKIQSIELLAGGIAHEFNNLLQVIQGYSEMLALEYQPPAQVPVAIREIRLATEQAAGLTAQLLTFACQREAVLVPNDLNEVVRGARALVGSTLLASSSIELSLEEELPIVRVDRAQVARLINNLARNSKDAGGDRILVRISTASVVVDEALGAREEDALPGRYVRLRYEDNGRGIAEDDIDRIFDPFFTTKKLGQGPGLGLSETHGIMKAHGGFLECRSQPGHGAIFDFYFPIALEHSQKN